MGSTDEYAAAWVEGLSYYQAFAHFFGSFFEGVYPKDDEDGEEVAENSDDDGEDGPEGSRLMFFIDGWATGSPEVILEDVHSE